jgi:hypothetical protein
MGELRIGERSSFDEQTLKPSTRQEGVRIGGKVAGAGNMPVPGAKVTSSKPALPPEPMPTEIITWDWVPRSPTSRFQSPPRRGRITTCGCSI